MFISDEPAVQIYTPAFIRQARINNRRRERLRKEAERQAALDAIVEAEREEARRRLASAARTLAVAQANFDALENRLRVRFTYREIERKACIVFGVRPSQLHGAQRSREIVFARQFVMYWAARLTKLSLPQIGRLMGGRDHTTILHGKSAYVDKRKAMGRTLRAAR